MGRKPSHRIKCTTTLQPQHERISLLLHALPQRRQRSRSQGLDQHQPSTDMIRAISREGDLVLHRVDQLVGGNAFSTDKLVRRPKRALRIRVATYGPHTVPGKPDCRPRVPDGTEMRRRVDQRITPVNVPGVAGPSPHAHATTSGLRVASMAPMRSISMRTTSPSLSNRGGRMAMPTPPGVPVKMMSPGSSVMAWLR